MVVLKHRLIIIKYGKFRNVLSLKYIVSTWMVHVVGGTRNKSKKDVKARHIATLFQPLYFNHLGKILSNIRSMYLRVVRVISIGLL